MALLFLTGGARSGKSRLAVELAASGDRDVVVIVTAETLDEEMAEKIARHRAERPAHWRTIEAPIELTAAVGAAGAGACVIVDCLTLWVANLMGAGRTDREIERAADELASAALRDGPTIVVSNEVGAGIVPDNASARRYRDLLGRVNAIVAAAANRSALVVAGRALALEDARSLLGAVDG
jgi:adenosyl cobinamide kinase/adenosyl cobinamide phosphate guanylyltransferase